MAQMSGLITLLSVSSSSLVTCFTSEMLLSLPSSSFSSTSLAPSLQSEPAPLSHSPGGSSWITTIPTQYHLFKCSTSNRLRLWNYKFIW